MGRLDCSTATYVKEWTATFDNFPLRKGTQMTVFLPQKKSGNKISDEKNCSFGRIRTTPQSTSAFSFLFFFKIPTLINFYRRPHPKPFLRKKTVSDDYSMPAIMLLLLSFLLLLVLSSFTLTEPISIYEWNWSCVFPWLSFHWWNTVIKRDVSTEEGTWSGRKTHLRCFSFFLKERKINDKYLWEFRLCWGGGN